MLPVGTRFEVVASSINKKGTKIRTGSVGYVAGVGNTEYINERPRKSSLVITPASVIITRFGHENRSRCETKIVGFINITAGIEKSYSTKSLQKLLDHSASYPDAIKEIFRKHGIEHPKGIPNIIVRKVLNSINITKDPSELLGWLTSIVSSELLNKPLDKDPEDFGIRKSLSNNLPCGIALLHKYRQDKVFMHKHILSYLQNDPAQFKQLINNLRTMLHLNLIKCIEEAQTYINSSSITVEGLFENFLLLYNNKIRPKVIMNKSLTKDVTNSNVQVWVNALNNLRSCNGL